MTQPQHTLGWFIIFSAALAFGIVWTYLGESIAKMLFTTIAFTFFIHSGISMDIQTHHSEHEADGNG